MDNDWSSSKSDRDFVNLTGSYSELLQKHDYEYILQILSECISGKVRRKA